MPLQTFVIDVPEGYNMRHSFYKVQSMSKDYVETRGRKPYIDLENIDDRDVKSKWKALNREKVQIYNKRYYDKKKAKQLEANANIEN